MSGTTLLVGACTAVVSGLAYAYVGLRIGGRRSAPEDRMALRAFGAWWFGLALLSLVEAAQTGLWLAGARDRQLFTAMTYLTLAPFCAMIWGLFYYLAYLLSGRREILWVSVGLYLLAYGAFVSLFAMSDPVGVKATAWNVRMEYARSFPPLVMLAAIGLLVLPVLGGAIAYGLLFFRVRNPLQRYRIAVVSLSLLLWFGSPLVAQLAGVAQSDAWGIASRVVGLLAALAILLAYRPPARVLRRLTQSSSRGDPWDG